MNLPGFADRHRSPSGPVLGPRFWPRLGYRVLRG